MMIIKIIARHRVTSIALSSRRCSIPMVLDTSYLCALTLKERKLKSYKMVMSSNSGTLANGDTYQEMLTKNATIVQNGHNGTKAPKTVSQPKGYLPISHNIITPEMAEYARKNLNETEENRKKGLQEIREILRSDPDLVFSDEEYLLLCYLRSRKFDAKRAAEFYKLGVGYLDSYRSSMERKDPLLVRRVIETNLIGFLPYRDAKNRTILYIKADRWDPNEIPAVDIIFANVMSMQSVIRNPVVQVNGFLVVFNLTNLTVQQVLKFSKYLIVGTLIFQRSLPAFIKAFHIINIPPTYKIGWKLIKPLLSEKIKNRIIFHKSNELSSLYEHVPKEILPVELGGPYEFSNEHWSWDLENIEEEYYNQLNKNYFKSKRKSTEQ